MADASYRLAHGTEVPVSIPEWRAPLVIRAGTSDADVFRQVVVQRDLEIPLSFRPRRIVDAGANIGISARVFAERWPEARIVAIELEAANVALLARNSASYPQVTVRHGGLWHGRGWVGVRNPGADAWMFAAIEQAADIPGAIPSFGVDDLLDDAGWDTVDLLKMDIEGGEIAVLNASARWIQRCRCIAVELHDRYAPGCREALERALDPGLWQVSRHGEYVVAERRVWIDSPTGR
jgi:FkbM family methyltransferase